MRAKWEGDGWLQEVKGLKAMTSGREQWKGGGSDKGLLKMRGRQWQWRLAARDNQGATVAV